MSGDRPTWDVAVVGAGPAGAVAAAELAAGGARVALFDPSFPRRKPCSGFLTNELFERYPPLRSFDAHRPFEGPRRYVAPSGRSFAIPASRAVTRFSVADRRQFDRFLLSRAEAAGAVWIEEGVMAIERVDNGWLLRTDAGKHHANFLVGADGARSRVRKHLIGSILPDDLVVGVGRFFVDRDQAELLTCFPATGGIAFLLPGYGFAQAVLAMRLARAERLQTRLDNWCRAQGDKWTNDYETWTALQPSPRSPGFFRRPVSGQNFCLVGDAAGHCDPLNGEGIPFAVQGGKQAAEAILSGKPEDYEERWRDLFSGRLEQAAAQARRTPPNWLINLAAWAMSRSPTLLTSVLEGATEKRTPTALAARVIPKSPRIAIELIRDRGNT